MAGRASIVGAAATHVGRVREHNEDSHFVDDGAGLFLVCDGMGGHAAGEVASALAVQTIRGRWLDATTRQLADAWLDAGTAETRKQLFGAIRAGVVAAHDQIISEGARDDAKSGMGTTLVGALLIGNELVFAHAGDSRAYLVRDGIAMQLTEDHTLLARLLAAGIDVDVSGEGARFRSMLTNALGIGRECKVATFVVPLADGDRFLLCSDGVSEYVPEAEVGVVLTERQIPARAAERLVELALERGGGDNATALVIGVREADKTPRPAELRRRDDEVIDRCPLWGPKLTPQQRLRALRIAIARDHAAGEAAPVNTLGDRVAWIVVEGTLDQEGREHGPGALIYPEALLGDGGAPAIGRPLAIARTDVRALALRADDFRELCDDDAELGEALLETLGTLVSGKRRSGRITRGGRAVSDHGRPDSNSDVIEPPPPVLAPLPIGSSSASEPDGRPTPAPPRRRAQTPAPETALAGAASPAATASAAPAPAGPAQALAQQAQAARLPAAAPHRPSPLPMAQPGPPRRTGRTTPPPAPGSPQRPQSRTTPPPPIEAQPVEAVPAAAEPVQPEPREGARPRTPSTPAPLPSATSVARAAAPIRPSGPLHPREATPGPAGLQTRPSGPAFARPVTPPPPLDPTGNRAPSRAESGEPPPPREARPPTDSPAARRPANTVKRATPQQGVPAAPRGAAGRESEPEIEAVYELDAEPPPLPEPEDDDPIAEMIVSVDHGDGRVVETTTETNELTLTVTVTEPPDEIESEATLALKRPQSSEALENEPTRIRARSELAPVAGPFMQDDQELDDDSAPAPRRPRRPERRNE